jgi:hypothetical protein
MKKLIKLLNSYFGMIGSCFGNYCGTDNACRKKELSQSICSICREVSRLNKQGKGVSSVKII